MNGKGLNTVTTEIRRCAYEDLALLRQIGIETFRETFLEQNSPEQLAAYLETAFKPERLEQEWSDPNSEIYLMFASGEAAGYLKVNAGDAQTERMGEEALEIERIYVRRKFHKRGLGKQLMDKAVEIASARLKKKVWLGVWEMNGGAIAFYEKQGFEQTGTHVFQLGDEAQTDLVMTRTISR